jgi:hypothetical protein
MSLVHAACVCRQQGHSRPQRLWLAWSALVVVALAVLFYRASSTGTPFYWFTAIADVLLWLAVLLPGAAIVALHAARTAGNFDDLVLTGLSLRRVFFLLLCRSLLPAFILYGLLVAALPGVYLCEDAAMALVTPVQVMTLYVTGRCCLLGLAVLCVLSATLLQRTLIGALLLGYGQYALFALVYLDLTNALRRTNFLPDHSTAPLFWAFPLLLAWLVYRYAVRTCPDTIFAATPEN